MNAITRNIPNSITCLNLAAGCMAVITSFKGDSTLWGMEAYSWSYIFIAIAAVADFLDGLAARTLRAYSDLGKELDSLCDLVSFGVAPTMLLFNCLETVGADDWLKWTALVIPVAGALRLARFNIDTRQTTSFIGLPIPANAIFWIGYTSLCHEGTIFLTQWPCALAIILLESWLMVSPIHLFSLKFKTWGWKGNEWRWGLIAAAVIMVACMGVSGLMWLIVTYVLMGLTSSNRN